jgi:hypothetical protein
MVHGVEILNVIEGSNEDAMGVVSIAFRPTMDFQFFKQEVVLNMI